MATKSLTVAAAGFSGLLALALLPLLATSAIDESSTCGLTPAGPIAVIQATIRQLESDDNYTVHSGESSASGAYEFIDSSWADYGGYPRAYLAPPAVQDSKAAELIESVLAQNHNDVTVVGVAWYLGHVPAPGSAEWDAVPAPEAGNRLTPRQYQERWMAIYRTKLVGAADATSDRMLTVACRRGASGPTLPGDWALPGPKDLLDRTAEQIDAPHHDYPAWDWPIPIGTPVFAMRGGTVVSVSSNPYNCSGQAGCERCGLGVTIADSQGVRWTYCHGSAVRVNQGDLVAAGQQILESGNSGNSSGPHLHIGVQVNGVARCPQPLVASLYRDGIGLDPSSLPTDGCTH